MTLPTDLQSNRSEFEEVFLCVVVSTSLFNLCISRPITPLHRDLLMKLKDAPRCKKKHNVLVASVHTRE